MKYIISITGLLLTGMAASIIVGVGEYMLHFLPEGPGGEIEMLLYVPLERASMGHFFVVIGAPLYFAGYYGIKKIFIEHQAFLARAILVLGVLSFSVGGVWVSSRFFAAEVLQRSANTLDHTFYLESYVAHYQILVWALRILVACISITYVSLILKNKIGLPKWLTIFNPIVLLVIVISSLSWYKPLGVQIAPIAMNVTHFIFFSLLLWSYRQTRALSK